MTYPIVRLCRLGIVVVVLMGALPARGAAPVDYNRDVRPILADHCFACHGPDKNRRKAELRLDDRPGALAKQAFVPGKPDESELVARINSADPDEVMPPPQANKPLSPAQKDVLKRWVAEGAVYAAHWSFTPIRRPEVPTLKDAAGVRNPIDAFIRANLEARKVAPAPEADWRTLIRRLSLDLTGLPPTPDEVNAFVADRDPQAYENLVKRLLASPHYGERMAVPWLDVVRYADTVGFHGDQNHNAWAYRDYVVDAFNANMPFDQFTLEQLAGDLLPNATTAQKTATCFNRLNMMTREGGAQPKEYMAKSAADRVRTVGMAWLGLTTGCAECHDHKFDPFTTRDFYSLSAFFADLKQWGVYQDYGYTPNPELRGWSNDHPFPPEITVDSPTLLRRIVRLREQVEAIAIDLQRSITVDASRQRDFAAWRVDLLGFLKEHPDGWQAELVSVNSKPAPPRRKGKTRDSKTAQASTSPPSETEPEDDGSARFTASRLTNDEFRLKPGIKYVGAIRVELMPAETGKPVLRAGVGGANVRLQAVVNRAGGKVEPIGFRAGAADRYLPRYQNGFETLGVLSGWGIDASIAGEPLTATYLPDRPIQLAGGDTLSVTILENPAARARVSVSPLAPEDYVALAPSGKGEADLERLIDADSPAMQVAYLRATGWNGPGFERLKGLEARVRDCRGGKTPVMVVEAIPPITTRVLPRGNWQDESGAVVTPAVPHFLPQPPSPASGRLSRLDLARWLTSKENPLVARVFVNRLWKQFFGTGLSAQVDDLGAQGEWPVHPELLDWLASEFRDSGWDVKRLITLIVTSATYRQNSNPRPEVFAIDPNNRLLASQSPRRLDAEFVRDNALSVAGLLNLEVGGPPSFAYQPAGYYVNLQFPDRDYIPDRDERQFRRGLYNHWQRTFLHPMLAAFDAPSREDCVAARTAANSPQQALTLLNDPEFVEAARVLAARLLRDIPRDDPGRLELAYQLALARSPRPEERESLLKMLAAVRETYAGNREDVAKLLKVGIAPVAASADPTELAAWAEVCRVILNLHETITRY